MNLTIFQLAMTRHFSQSPLLLHSNQYQNSALELRSSKFSFFSSFIFFTETFQNYGSLTGVSHYGPKIFRKNKFSNFLSTCIKIQQLDFTTREQKITDAYKKTPDDLSSYELIYITECLFLSVVSNVDFGGAIYLESSTTAIKIDKVYFYQCSCLKCGGGLYLSLSQAVRNAEILSTCYCDCFSENYGSCIYGYGGFLFQECGITANNNKFLDKKSKSGCLIYKGPDYTTISNANLTGGYANQINTIYCDGSASFKVTFASFELNIGSYSLIISRTRFNKQIQYNNILNCTYENDLSLFSNNGCAIFFLDSIGDHVFVSELYFINSKYKDSSSKANFRIFNQENTSIDSIEFSNSLFDVDESRLESNFYNTGNSFNVNSFPKTAGNSQVRFGECGGESSYIELPGIFSLPFTPSHKFTPSGKFSPSNEFSESQDFSASLAWATTIPTEAKKNALTTPELAASIATPIAFIAVVCIIAVLIILSKKKAKVEEDDDDEEEEDLCETNCDTTNDKTNDNNIYDKSNPNDITSSSITNIINDQANMHSLPDEEKGFENSPQHTEAALIEDAQSDEVDIPSDQEGKNFFDENDLILDRPKK